MPARNRGNGKPPGNNTQHPTRGGREGWRGGGGRAEEDAWEQPEHNPTLMNTAEGTFWDGEYRRAPHGGGTFVGCALKSGSSLGLGDPSKQGQSGTERPKSGPSAFYTSTCCATLVLF